MIRAYINGRIVQTSKALKVFERVSASVNGRLGMVDAGLATGTLETKSAQAAIQEAFQSGSNKLSFKEIVYYYRLVNWSTIRGPKWAVQSAEAFVAACVLTCAEIELEEFQ